VFSTPASGGGSTSDRKGEKGRVRRTGLGLLELWDGREEKKGVAGIEEEGISPKKWGRRGD